MSLTFPAVLYGSQVLESADLLITHLVLPITISALGVVKFEGVDPLLGKFSIQNSLGFDDCFIHWVFPRYYGAGRSFHYEILVRLIRRTSQGLFGFS